MGLGPMRAVIVRARCRDGSRLDTDSILGEGSAMCGARERAAEGNLILVYIAEGNVQGSPNSITVGMRVMSDPCSRKPIQCCWPSGASHQCSVQMTGFARRTRTGLDDNDLDAVLAQRLVTAQAPPAQPVLAGRVDRLKPQQ